MRLFGNKFDKLANQMDEKTLRKINDILNSKEGQNFVNELKGLDTAELQKKFEGIDLNSINLEEVTSKLSNISVNEVLKKMQNTDPGDLINKIVDKEE